MPRFAPRFKPNWQKPNYKKNGFVERSLLTVFGEEIQIQIGTIKDYFPVCFGVKNKWDEEKKEYIAVDSGWYFKKWKSWEKISGKAISEQIAGFIPENITIQGFLEFQVKEIYEKNFLPKRECKLKQQ